MKGHQQKSVYLPMLIFLLWSVIAAPALAVGLVDVDYRALVSRSDLVYLRPATQRGHGHPIGNGVMGTQVWTTDDSLEFQINRTDLFATNNEHSGKYGDWRDENGTDICGACARISVGVGGPVFKGDGEFRQRLSIYDARDVIQGNNVRAQIFVASNRDLMVLQWKQPDGMAASRNVVMVRPTPIAL